MDASMTPTEDELARPLTAEEEAAVRERAGKSVTWLSGTMDDGFRIPDALHRAVHDRARLLATLDALRATPVADTAGIDAAHLAAVLWAEFGWASPDPDQTRPTLLDADDPYWQQAAERSIAKLADPDLARAVSRIPALAAALRTPKPEGDG